MFMFGDWVLRPFLLVSTVLKFTVFDSAMRRLMTFRCHLQEFRYALFRRKAADNATFYSTFPQFESMIMLIEMNSVIDVINLGLSSD